MIAALALAWPQTLAQGWWSQLQPAWQVGALVIRRATIGFTRQIADEIQGLEKGGFYIGCLERGLVMLLILMGQPAGVGFLITAKSILRFGDVKESSQRKLTESIIIGTFMSFGWGLLVVVLTQLSMQHWLPASGHP